MRGGSKTEDASHSIKDEGDHDLRNMMPEIIDIHEEAFCTGKTEFTSNKNALMQ